MNKIDSAVDKILDSYEKYGGINLEEAVNFPNQQNVISVLKDLCCLIFPGYTVAEYIDSQTLRFITGERVNRIVAMLTREIQKALYYIKKGEKIENSHCFALAEKTALALIEEIPEIRRKIGLDVQAAYLGDPAAKSSEEVIHYFESSGKTSYTFKKFFTAF